VAAWPLAARAQQGEWLRRIGVLMVNAESDADGQARAGAFRQRLRDLGWAEGRNIRIDYRWGAGDADRARVHANEVAASAPDAILATALRRWPHCVERRATSRSCSS
jgi:putative ABC transport system substrate-binding protein